MKVDAGAQRSLTMSDAIHGAIADLGRGWAAAELQSDVRALRSMLTDDFVCVGPLGFLLTKEQYLQSRESGDLEHESFAWDDVRVRRYGDAIVAVGSQTQTSTYRERDASGRFRVTQVWARQGDTWAIAGMHLSPIAQPPAAGSPPGGPGTATR
jgi:ketosteroid isomerase-like protein